MSDDDRIALMEIIIQSIENLFSEKNFPPKQWQKVKKLIELNSVIHRYTVYYWSDFDEYVPCFDTWSISKEMNKLYFSLYKNN